MVEEIKPHELNKFLCLKSQTKKNMANIATIK